MRRLLVVLLLIVSAQFLSAQPHQADDVAHGSEKASHEIAHPNQDHGDQNAEPKFLGLPAWIFKLINMVIFIGALVYFIGRPAKNAIAERHAGIQRAAEEARSRRTKADQVASDIQSRLGQLEDELRAIREKAEQDGERQKRELLAAAENEAAKILAGARAEVENRIKHARHELTEYAGQLASDRAERILRDRMTEQDRQRLFRESLHEVEGARS